jgi:hypothetical protein
MASHVRPHFCNDHTAEHRRAHRKRRSGSPNCRKSNISMGCRCNRLARAQQRQKLEQTSTSMDYDRLSIRLTSTSSRANLHSWPCV